MIHTFCLVTKLDFQYYARLSAFALEPVILLIFLQRIGRVFYLIKSAALMVSFKNGAKNKGSFPLFTNISQ